MIKLWRSHFDYQQFLIQNLKRDFKYFQPKILQLSKAISKLYIFNLDPLKDIISHLFSSQGRPAINQPEIMRSFVFMNAMKFHSITQWVQELHANPLYCYIIGVEPNNIPSIGAHYDFIKRLWMADSDYDKTKILISCVVNSITFYELIRIYGL